MGKCGAHSNRAPHYTMHYFNLGTCQARVEPAKKCPFAPICFPFSRLCELGMSSKDTGEHTIEHQSFSTC